MKLTLFFVIAIYLGNARYGGDVSSRLRSTTVRLRWAVDFADQSVLFTVVQSNDRLGYVIVGFSDHGYYNNSDICIYRYGQMRDGYIDGSFEIQYDRSQDCQLERQYGNMFQFRRRFATCDPKDFAFEAGTTQFILAGGYEFTRDFSSNTVIKDMQFGLLLQMDNPILPAELATSVFKIVADGARISYDITTYWCVIKRIPEAISQQKHHIIEILPYIQKGNERLVHHMEIFMCKSENQEDYSGKCDALLNSKDARTCSHVLAAWAMGEGPIYYPPEAGRPIGGESGEKYLKVEIHYNNPEMLSDITDESGFEIVMTPNLRKYDAGIMELGLIYSDANSIPPGQSAFPLTSYCIKDCTEKLPEEGIYIFGSQLHAHLSGRKIVTSQYRHGVKIGEINRDDHYSPHWQHVVHLRPYIHVLPGDVLTTTCVYETLSRSTVTLGGYGIEDEMCVNYIYYYPLSDVEVCKSAVDNATLHKYFGHQHGIHKESLPLHKKYASVEWNTKNTLSLKEMFSVAPLNMHCLQHDGTLFPGHPLNWTAVPLPHVHMAPITRRRDTVECPALND